MKRMANEFLISTGHGSYGIGVSDRYTAGSLCHCWGGGVAEGRAGREWGGEGEDIESVGVEAGSCAVLIPFIFLRLFLEVSWKCMQ